MSVGDARRASRSNVRLPSSSTPRSIPKLADERVRLWGAFAMKARDRPGEPVKEPRVHFPVITVSRTFGAHGIQIAKRVSDALCFSLWGKELVSTTAKQVGASLRSVHGLDERVRTSWEDLVDTMVYDTVPQHEFTALLLEVIRSVARMGSAVVVGRGAQYVVDPKNALRVRIDAPLELRVGRYAEKRELSLKEAERIVRETDREREQFIKHYFLMDSNDIHHYDLCLNTAHLSANQACSMIIHAYDSKFSGLVDFDAVNATLETLDQNGDPEDRSSIPATPPGEAATAIWPLSFAEGKPASWKPRQ